MTLKKILWIVSHQNVYNAELFFLILYTFLISIESYSIYVQNNCLSVSSFLIIFLNNELFLIVLRFLAFKK